jgi:hypothetical protein
MSQGYRNGNSITFSSDGAMTNGPPRTAAPSPSEEGIDQVRDLLFGALRREIDQRLSALERRVDAMEQSLKSYGEAQARDRKAAFEQLSRGVADLAEDIRRINRST